MTNSPSSPQSADPSPNPTDARKNFVGIAHRYAQDVLSGEQPACKWVKLACQRHLDDLEQSKDESYPYVFDETKASRLCRFLEQLPHVKGEWAKAGEKIRLEPWHCFICCSLFGWVHRDLQTRRFRLAYIAVPRKNGKSTLAAGLGLYMLAADGEMGAEVYAGATCERQAWEVFRPAKQMVERTPRLGEVFGLKANARNISVLSTGSRFEPVVAKPGDGASPSCSIIDEYHEHATDELVDTMRTGMGARKQPLQWIITTAGSNIGGPCHAQQREVEQVLEDSIQRDELFGIVYTVDEGDDWTSREALIKANPNFGISVFEEFLREQQNAAIQSPRKQNVFKTKHLNIWVGAATAWMNMERWKQCSDARLSANEVLGCPAFGAGDLSSKLDLTAIVWVFKKLIEGAEHYYIFGRYFLPAERLKVPELEQYRNWALEGYLETTPGNVIDYEHITERTVAEANKYRALQFGYDPWNAEHFAQKVGGLTSATVVEIPQQVRFMSEPMKQLEALVIDGRIHHDGNPVMNWMMSNVVAHTDAKGNVFPRKEKDHLKIDGPVALIMALSRAIPYEDVGGSHEIELW